MLADGWKWVGGGSTPPQDIEPSHQASVSKFEIKKPTNCVYLYGNNKLKDQECDKEALGVCTIGYGSVGLGASIGMIKIDFFYFWTKGESVKQNV